MVGEAHTLVEDVDVWASMSLLTQVTVVPTDTVAGFGTYAVVVNPVAPRGIEIVNGVGVPPGEGGVGVGVGAAGAVGELLPQPAARTAQATRATVKDARRMGTVAPAASGQLTISYLVLRISWPRISPPGFTVECTLT